MASWIEAAPPWEQMDRLEAAVKRHVNELTILRAFAAQMMGMGAQHKFDTHLQAFYCVLCEAAAKPGMDTEIEHKDGCLVPIVEDMPISL